MESPERSLRCSVRSDRYCCCCSASMGGIDANMGVDGECSEDTA
jgi:hypothetical protein